MQQKDSEAARQGRPPRPSRRRVVEVVVTLVILLVASGIVVKVVLVPGPKPPEVITPTSTLGPTPEEVATDALAGACLSTFREESSLITKLAGEIAGAGSTVNTLRLQRVAGGKTYDLRGVTIAGYPTVHHYPLLLGKGSPGRATCVIGGTVVGQQSRSLTWQVMKRKLDGDGLNFKSYGGIVDGIRIDNVEDGIATVGADPGGIAIRNAYMTYIRDDCIENDGVVGLVVQDSLLDGCYMGLSERPSGQPKPSPADERTLLSRVLMRIQPMPYDKTEATCGRDGMGNGGFFKWSKWANRLVVRNTILLAERVAARCRTPMHFPEGTYENVTLVWLGPGDYPGRLPDSGVTVTRDRSVWAEARADWLSRHGR
jgi:hypothetical protein